MEFSVASLVKECMRCIQRIMNRQMIKDLWEIVGLLLPILVGNSKSKISQRSLIIRIRYIYTYFEEELCSHVQQ